MGRSQVNIDLVCASVVVEPKISISSDDYWTFWLELNNINLDDMWLHQDGATLHYADETIVLLKKILMVMLFKELSTKII